MLFRSLVKKEDVRGFKRLARYYEQGIGVQPNRELYKDYVLKAAETRDPEALVEKARLLIKGEDLEPDPKMALDILTDLEENQTHAVPGMHFLLGYLHEEGLGTPQDMALAYQFYIKGAVLEGGLDWQPHQDSNLEILNQNQVCYQLHYGEIGRAHV